MTSLASQLHRLQIPGTSVNERLSVKRASILFDKDTAARLDNDAVFNIGKNGFQNLLEIDPLFGQYGNMFDSRTLQVQRSAMEKSYEVKTKKKIEEFLLLLSPYLQLQCAKKVLEWLVRQFEIHIFDVDSLMRCIIPYHETQIFFRIVQIIKYDSSEGLIWDHLIPKLKKYGKLNIQTLICHCAANKSLFHFICDTVEKAAKLTKTKSPKSGFHLLFSFYTRLMCGVLDKIEFTEQSAAQLLPVIQSGLQSDVKDYICCNYILITVLLSKTQLKKNIVKRLMVEVIQSMDYDWYEYGLLCMISIVHVNHRLSSKIIPCLLEKDPNELLGSLVQLEQKYDIENFVGKMLLLLCKNCGHLEDSNQLFSMIMKLIDSFTFKDDVLKLVSSLLLRSFVDKTDGDDSNLINVLKPLAARHSSAFDGCLGELLTKYKSDKKTMTRLKKLAVCCLPKGGVVQQTDLPLVLCLNHPEKELRRMGVEQLCNIIESGNHELDIGFIKESLLMRLRDDEPSIVNKVLQCSDFLFSILSEEEIKSVVENLTSTNSALYKMSPFYRNIVNNLDDLNSVIQKEFLFSALCQLFKELMTKKFDGMVRMFTSEKLTTHLPIIIEISNALSTVSTWSSKTQKINISRICALTVERLAENMSWDLFLCMLDYSQRSPNDTLAFLINLILIVNVSNSRFLVMKVLELPLRNSNISSEEMSIVEMFQKFTDYKTAIESMFEMALSPSRADFENIDGNMAGLSYFALLKLMLGFQKELEAEGSDFVRGKLFSLIAPAAVFGQEGSLSTLVHQNLLKEYLQTTFNNDDNKIEFLLLNCTELLLTEESVFVNANIEEASVILAILNIISISQKEVPDLVIGLHLALLRFPHKKIRKAALKNLNTFHEQCKESWTYLLRDILNNKSEIKLDETAIERRIESKLTKKASKFRKGNEFAMLSNKSSKNEKQMEQFIGFFNSILKTFPIPVRLRLMEITRNVNLGEGCIEDITTLNIDDRHPKTYAIFYQHVLDQMCKIVGIRENHVQFIFECLRSNHPTLTGMTLDKMKHLFDKFDSEDQFSLIRVLLESLQSANVTSMSSQFRATLRELTIDSQHVSKLLRDACKDIDSNLKKSSSETTDSATEDNAALRKSVDMVDEILVAVNNSNLSSDLNTLVSATFFVLERCFKIDGEFIEFTKQLCLSLLAHTAEKGLKQLSFHRYKVTALLECLRTTENIQTKESCLKAISSAVALYPTHTLHNVMEIFSFMGGSMMKLDNEHTFAVIKETIYAIVPILLQKTENPRKRAHSSNIDEVIVFILQTFIDSCPHCPEHRRDFILSHLLQALGLQNLGKAMLLLVKKVSEQSKYKKDVIEDPTQSQSSEKCEYEPLTLDFCHSYFSLYDVKDQLSALHQMASFLFTIPLEIDYSKTKKKVKTPHSLIDIQALGEKQMRLFTYAVISFMMAAIRSSDLANSFATNDVNEMVELTKCYEVLSEALITYESHVKSACEETADGSVARKYGEKLIEKIARMTELAVAHVPLIAFTTLVTLLLDKESMSVKNKALELFTRRIEATRDLENVEGESVVMLLKKIANELVQYQVKETSYTQYLLYTIKVVAITSLKNTASASSDMTVFFLEIVPVAVHLYSDESVDKMVSVNALLVMAELSSFLNVRLLSKLEGIVAPIFAKIINPSVGEHRKDCLMFTCCVTTLKKMFSTLKLFMNPYLVPVFKTFSIYNALGTARDETLISVVEQFKIEIGEIFNARILLPAVNTFVETVTDQHMVSGVLDICGVIMNKMTTDEINSTFRDEISAIFRSLFGMPCVLTSDKLETGVIDIICKLSLRMTEKTLKAVYAELFHWATSFQNATTPQRLLSFYRLSIGLAETLQGLFLLLASIVVEKSSELLEAVTTGSVQHASVDVQRHLLTALLDCLTAIFRYDTHGFVNRERFQLISKPLVDQMDCPLYEGMQDGYTKLISNHLLPCIVHLAAAVNDPICWKSLNHGILSKTRSKSVQVRLASLDVIGKIYDRLGESFMVLVPETIPYLSEVLEDDSLEVERKCRVVINQIETITGESIQKYF